VLTEDVFSAAPKPPSIDDFVQIDSAVIQSLFTALSAAARIRALIADRPRRKSQKISEYEVQTKRIAWLRDEVLHGVKLERLLDGQVRNTIEHFDEYIDRSALGFATGKFPTPSLAPIDFVVSRRRALQRFALERKVPNLHFMRAFIASERVFVNCGHEISIQGLHTECRRIVKRLVPLVPDPEAQGSSMMVITTETFRPPPA
jgi:hypothetical protein